MARISQPSPPQSESPPRSEPAPEGRNVRAQAGLPRRSGRRHSAKAGALGIGAKFIPTKCFSEPRRGDTILPRRNQPKTRLISTRPIRIPHRLLLTYWYYLCYAVNVFCKRTTSLAAPKPGEGGPLVNRRTNLLDHPFFARNSFRMTSSEKCHFKPFRITSSGDKDLKSFRINTSKKHPGVGGYRRPPCIGFFDSRPDRRPV
jgi:hypothetical protein